MRYRRGNQPAVGGLFWRFWSARTLNIGGDQIFVVALAAHVYGLHHNSADLSGVLLAFSLPRFLSPLSGALADNLDSKIVMLIVDLAQALVLIPLALHPDSVFTSVAAAFMLTLLSTVYLPAGRRSIGRLARNGSVGRAYGLIGTSWNLGWALGPALGGILLGATSMSTVIVLDIATFAGSALLVTSLPRLPAERPQRMRAGQVASTLALGVKIVARDRRLRSVGVITFAVVSFASIDVFALLILNDRSFAGAQSTYGLLVSMSGAGMVAASLFFSARPAKSPVRQLMLGQLLFATGAVGTGLAGTPVLAGAAQAVAGAGNGTENIASDVIVQLAAPPSVLGTVSGVLVTLPFIGNTVAYAVSPAVVGMLGARGTLAASGIAVAIAAVTFRVTSRSKAMQADSMALIS